MTNIWSGRLRGCERSSGDAPHHIVEFEVNQPPRIAQTVTPAMVASLVDAG